jgi:hypothetical protein
VTRARRVIDDTKSVFQKGVHLSMGNFSGGVSNHGSIGQALP